jgi:hypothetical protein
MVAHELMPYLEMLTDCASIQARARGRVSQATLSV